MTEGAQQCAFCKSKLAGQGFGFEARGNSRQKVRLASCDVCTRNVLERVWEMRRSLDFTERRIAKGKGLTHGEVQQGRAGGDT